MHYLLFIFIRAAFTIDRFKLNNINTLGMFVKAVADKETIFYSFLGSCQEVNRDQSCCPGNWIGIIKLSIESYTFFLILCLSGQQWCAPSSMSSVTRRLSTWQAQIWPTVDSTGSWISAGTLFPSGRWTDARGTEHFLSGTHRKHPSSKSRSFLKGICDWLSTCAVSSDEELR